MKVLFMADDFPPTSFGGAGISTYELAEGVHKAGNEVFVITTCRKESESGESEYKGLKVFRIASDYNGRWRAWIGLYNPPVLRQVKKLLKKIQPDVVHINNVHYHISYHCFKLAKKYAKAVVWTARDTMAFTYGKLNTERYLKNFDYKTTWADHLSQAGKRWNPFRNFCIKRYLRLADKLFAVSESLKLALQQNGIAGVSVLHTGIDVNSYKSTEESIKLFRQKYALGGKKVILFAGRLSGSKGGWKSLEMIKLVIQDIPNAVLLIAGIADAYAAKTIEHAKNIGTQIIFTGWVGHDDMKTAYAVSDVVVVPSIHLDSFPRIVLEAMASGKPVIGTCYGGASEVIEDGVTGYIVNPLDAHEMAVKIIGLLKNPAKIEQFGKSGYERIKTKFSLKKYAGNYISQYQELMERKTASVS